MQIAMNNLCCVFSRAFDIIEAEQLGASERHSMRVAALVAAMGGKLGFDDDAVLSVAVCALFHDNALTEYHLSKEKSTESHRNMILHCEKGQANIKWLPFKKNVDGFILYHHETGDGKGLFGKKDGEFPFEASLIAAADSADVDFHFQRITAEQLLAVKEKISQHAEDYSTRKAVDVLLDVLTPDMLEKLRDENISQTIENALPKWTVDLNEPNVLNAANFIARVIDYKSPFTRKHTVQIANRAWVMAEFYGYSREEKSALFLAAALHDIGKIATPIEILEKPGKLTAEEFEIIKQHVKNTHDWLLGVPQFDLIRDWAAGHHEKLNGSGYSFGKSSEELDFNTRLIACLDIYQAVCEPRPYHEARTHEDTMAILYDMAGKGFVDEGIVKDVDEIMREYSLKDVPAPTIV